MIFLFFIGNGSNRQIACPPYPGSMDYPGISGQPSSHQGTSQPPDTASASNGFSQWNTPSGTLAHTSQNMQSNVPDLRSHQGYCKSSNSRKCD